MEVNIFGATGLVGSHLLQECLKNEKVKKINIFVRKPLDIKHEKLHQVIATFEGLSNVNHEIKGEVVFNCLGTTLKKAGSEAAQYRIDCEYPIRVAKIAAENKIPCMVNISSVGASETGNFYLKTKANMERDVSEAIGEKSYFLRPSFILGDRNEFRLGEKIGIYLMILINPFLLGGWRKYRSINANNIAKAMLEIGLKQPNTPKILYYDEIIQFSK